MMRHVVLFTWKAGVTDEQVSALERGLRSMPEVIPEIRNYEMGRDLGIGHDTADYVLIADFDSADAYRRYSAHPDHVALIDDLVRPIVESTFRADVAV